MLILKTVLFILISCFLFKRLSVEHKLKLMSHVLVLYNKIKDLLYPKKEDTLYVEDNKLIADVIIGGELHKIEIPHHVIDGSFDIKIDGVNTSIFTDGKIKGSEFTSTYVIVGHHSEKSKVIVEDSIMGDVSEKEFHPHERIHFSWLD